MNLKDLPSLFLLAIPLMILSSCAMYRQDFECLPPCGTPCRSVTDIESMIIETQTGPDLFLTCEQSTVDRVSAIFKRKIWVSDGSYNGYYLFQTKEVKE